MKRQQLRILHNTDQNRFRTGNLLPFVVPIFRWRHHVFADARASRRVLQPLNHFGVAAIVRPRRNESGKAIEPCGVSIGIGGDIHARFACRINFGDNFRHAPPIVLARHFDMPDLHRNVCLAADAQRFVDGRQYGIAFIPHVRRVDSPKFRRFTCQRNDLFGLRVRSRGILQRRRNTNCAVAHTLPHQLLHLLELLRRGLLVIVAQHHAADLGRPNIAG